MPGRGLEPLRTRHRILSPPRLPFRHPGAAVTPVLRCIAASDGASLPTPVDTMRERRRVLERRVRNALRSGVVNATTPRNDVPLVPALSRIPFAFDFQSILRATVTNVTHWQRTINPPIVRQGATSARMGPATVMLARIHPRTPHLRKT